MHRGSPTYKLPFAGDHEPVQLVARTCRYAEVHLVGSSGEASRIGLVRLEDGSWSWEHRDGERSCSIAPTSSAAAQALADYHRRHKPGRRRVSVRELLQAPKRARI